MSDLLVKTRVILITHIHGDHAFGIYKMLLERDHALNTLPEAERTPVYCVIPEIMHHSVRHFIEHEVVAKDLIKLIHNGDCNPEPQEWYSS